MLSGEISLNIGDLLFQLIMLIIVIGVPLGILFLFVKRKKQNRRMDQIEEKIDQILQYQKKNK
ncbi:DUF4083 family protein [Bacillus sp. Marseille-P3661]|uniref:DUF4083 family protein n=1 Tax=Bacillus sp. Marseille-P3661 TaxID=1936234 RepID=UPI000C81F1F2|nr:DUF4083 family protein [Bacillus sp. Marseille-P3661]